jgi:hypothetical protein
MSIVDVKDFFGHSYKIDEMFIKAINELSRVECGKMSDALVIAAAILTNNTETNEYIPNEMRREKYSIFSDWLIVMWGWENGIHQVDKEDEDE